MQLMQFDGLSRAEVEKLLLYIPTFRQIKDYSETQFQLLLASAKVVKVEPGEKLIDHGSENQQIFFLLRGQLKTVARRNGQPVPLNVIEAGEIFGEMALLLNQPRSADIILADSCRQALVFTLESEIFQNFSQFTLIDDTTKLIFYRHLVHHLRWQLDKLRNQYPSHPLADKHRQMKLTLLKNDAKQLPANYTQAKNLADLLLQWNPSLVHLAS